MEHMQINFFHLQKLLRVYFTCSIHRRISIAQNFVYKHLFYSQNLEQIFAMKHDKKRLYILRFLMLTTSTSKISHKRQNGVLF